MTEKINAGGPAFPHPNPEFSQGYGVGRPFGGMTLRDYFAGQTITGYIAKGAGMTDWKVFAELAYKAADAMLVERART